MNLLLANVWPSPHVKRNVPRIIEDFEADPENVFLCGFSRAAIGVNYIGLHDDETASLWTAFITHDHFPNEFAVAGHTDRWLLKPSVYRSKTWAWMNAVEDN